MFSPDMEAVAIPTVSSWVHRRNNAWIEPKNPIKEDDEDNPISEAEEM